MWKPVFFYPFITTMQEYLIYYMSKLFHKGYSDYQILTAYLFMYSPASGSLV